ncbi:hypothetical protein TeGR_g6836 [Tetraparma gracilis]|uniref:Uncharacterized protein n=1 Tax=Tetraparma gracilis TaxID=2962635 RepID=A0ABQ6MWE3_9STRA|nr:hypothetical protein TeGR_g6836 [Tetraparma gracilis]
MLDITSLVNASCSGLPDGLALVTTPHTTCGLLVNEWERGLSSDLSDFFSELSPSDKPALHNDVAGRPSRDPGWEGEAERAGAAGWDLDDPEVLARWRKQEPANAHAHLLTSLLSTSLALPVANGSVALGAYQSVIFADADAPRSRTFAVTLFPSPPPPSSPPPPPLRASLSAALLSPSPGSLLPALLAPLLGTPSAPLRGRYRLLHSPGEPYRSSPFFWSLRAEHASRSPSLADAALAFTDGIPFKRSGPAFQTLTATSILSEVAVTASLPPLPPQTSTMVTEATVRPGAGANEYLVSAVSTSIRASSLFPFLSGLSAPSGALGSEARARDWTDGDVRVTEVGGELLVWERVG